MAFKANPFFSTTNNRPVLVKRERQVDWKTLKPGSREWLEFWKTHPELQEQMLEFKKGVK